MKKIIALTLVLSILGAVLAGCGQGGAEAEADVPSNAPAYNELTVGTDYTDLTAEVKFISHRTDLIEDGTAAPTAMWDWPLPPRTRW